MSGENASGRPNLDEIRRDLFHAEGDKVCTGRLIRQHAPALLAEVERLRDGIRQHEKAARADYAESEWAGLAEYDERLWALPDDPCTHESVDTFASGAGRRVDVCMGCERVLRFWNANTETA